jgi:hypothetical protein
MSVETLKGVGFKDRLKEENKPAKMISFRE